MSDAKLRFRAHAIRRELPSDHHELSPVTEPSIVSYGDWDRTAMELTLALSELAEGMTIAGYRYTLNIVPTDYVNGTLLDPAPADFNPRPSLTPGVPTSGTWTP